MIEICNSILFSREKRENMPLSITFVCLLMLLAAIQPHIKTICSRVNVGPFSFQEVCRCDSHPTFHVDINCQTHFNICIYSKMYFSLNYQHENLIPNTIYCIQLHSSTKSYFFSLGRQMHLHRLWLSPCFTGLKYNTM